MAFMKMKLAHESGPGVHSLFWTSTGSAIHFLFFFFSTQQANSSLTFVQKEEKILLVSWQYEGVLSMAMTLGRFVACPSGDKSVEVFMCVYVYSFYRLYIIIHNNIIDIKEYIIYYYI